jgi:flagellar M-ring protein FliF
MLEPLAGVGNVRAVVKATYDHGSEERTDEVYDPTLVAPLSIQKSEQMSNNGAGRPSGVPGTASNSPAAAVAGAVQGSAVAAAPGTPPLLQAKDAKDALPVYPQAGGAMQNVKQESATYGVSKHTIHSETGPGRLERVSAAVVVNDRVATEGTGKDAKEVWKPRTVEEMHRLEVLAQAAVGFDPKRGDQVVMQNVSFSTNTPEMKMGGLDKVFDQARGILSSQPGAMRTMVTGLVGLLVILFVLKPVANQVIVTLREPAMIATSASVAGLSTSSEAELQAGSLGDGTHMDWEGALSGETMPRRLTPVKNPIFEQVAEHIKRSPKESTRILENWISPDGGPE